MLATLALLGAVLAQNPSQARTASDARVGSSVRPALVTDSGAVALRTNAPPVIDGRDNDAVWRAASVISGFREWRPTEDKDPRFRTEAKVAYDAANLYVFVRSFDAHPDSIIRLLERRDTFTPSDMVWILVDAYHDRLNGYEFGQTNGESLH